MTAWRPLGSLGMGHGKEFFERIGATPGSVYRPLARTAADDGNPDQNGAIYYLGRGRYLRAIPLLIRLAREWDARNVSGLVIRLGPVCDALGMMDDPRAHRELVRLYEESPELWTRGDAVDALGYEKRCAEPERLIRILRSDENEVIRMSAIWAMVEQADWNAFAPYEAAVVEAIRDPEPIVRGLAASALGRSKRPEFLPLIEAMLADHSPCRFLKTVVSALAKEAFDELETWARRIDKTRA